MNSGAAGNPMNIPNGPRLDDAQMSAGASAVNLSQYRGSSQSAATQHAVMQHQMMQQQKQPSAGPQGPHMPHMQHSQQPPLSQAPGGQGPLRRDSAALSQPRDASLQLRNLWTQDGPSIDNPGMSGMPGNVPQMQGMQGPTANSLLMGGGVAFLPPSCVVSDALWHNGTVRQFTSIVFSVSQRCSTACTRSMYTYLPMRSRRHLVCTEPSWINGIHQHLPLCPTLTGSDYQQ